MIRFPPLPDAKFFTIIAVAIAGAALLDVANVSAAPTAEVAKRCLHFSYVAYPFKRPGAVPMSGDRHAYFQDCISKNGDVPDPSPPKS
jgi:hypothetical protein